MKLASPENMRHGSYGSSISSECCFYYVPCIARCFALANRRPSGRSNAWTIALLACWYWLAAQTRQKQAINSFTSEECWAMLGISYKSPSSYCWRRSSGSLRSPLPCSAEMDCIQHPHSYRTKQTSNYIRIMLHHASDCSGCQSNLKTMTSFHSEIFASSSADSFA